MKSKPRIAYLLQMFGVGGMPKWLYRLAGELQNEFDFTFIATHSKHVENEYRKVAKVVVLPFNNWVIGAYLYRRFDIVQTANLRPYVDAAHLARIPVIIERVDGLRGGVALGDKTGLDAVIASTKGIVPELEKLISLERIHVIHNGVDLAEYERAAPNRFGFNDEDVIVGRTSRLAAGKNISLLIRSVIELRKENKYKHVRLVICGGDTTQPGSIPMLARLKQEAKPLGGSVIFTGEVFDTTAITSGYDIATCTSRPNNEGIPNSLIEGMAAGKPVIASNIDDIPELVENSRTGLLFSDNDLAGIIDALKTLVDNEQERIKMGKLGRQRIDIEFNLKKQAGKYADLYRELLSNK